MTWSKACITISVVRLIVRLVLPCLLMIFAQRAEASKFIVRFKAQREIHPLIRVFAKQKSLLNLTTRVNSESRNVRAKALTHINVMLAEGTREEVTAAVAGDDSVAYIEEDKEIHLAEANNFGAQTENSPYLNVVGLNAADPAYTLAPYATPVLVAVIDTGINLSHPYFTNFISVNAGEIANNGIDDDHNGYIDDVNGASVLDMNGNVNDVYDHGTHVAGLVKTVRDQAIALNYTEARNIQVLPIRFFYNCGAGLCGTTSGAILALDYAMSRGAKVVNMSWGSGGSASYSQALYETLADLYAHDISLVAAAGNETTDTDAVPFFPASLSTAIPGLISVNSITTWHTSTGATDEITISSFSNYAVHSVDVAAPGSTFTPTQGSGLYGPNASYPATSLVKFIRKSGTSMASPVVAGIAAVVRALNAGLTSAEVKQLILQNAVVPRDGSNQKILANMNRAEGYAHGPDSFEAALSTVTAGYAPASISSSYSTANSDNDQGGGGCGAVIHPGSGGGNPFGGNSLGLFTAAFFLVQFVRRMRYKTSQC